MNDAKQKAVAARDAMDKAVRALETDLGFKVKQAKVLYSLDGTFTVKFECGSVGADGAVATKEATAFKQSAKFLGFTPEDLGREFKVRGITYRLDGYRPSARKRPLVATRVDTGRAFVFDMESVRLAMGMPNRITGGY